MKVFKIKNKLSDFYHQNVKFMYDAFLNNAIQTSFHCELSV